MIITALMLILSASAFCAARGLGEYHMLTAGLVKVPDDAGNMHRITAGEIASRTARAASRGIGPAVVAVLVLLVPAWPFARFYRQGPREIAALAGLVTGGVLGGLLSIPFLLPFPFVSAGAVLFGGLASALPRRGSAAGGV